MYLGHRGSRKGRSYAGIRDKDLPPRITDEACLVCVQILRTQAIVPESVHHDLVNGHMRLTLSIACRYISHWYMKRDDIWAVACLALVEAVHSFRTASKDNNITPYIVSCIHYKISDFLRDDRVIRYSRDYFLENYRSIENVEALPLEEPRAMATRDVGALEVDFQDLISNVPMSKFEDIIMKAMLQGIDDRELGLRLGYSKQHINKIKQTLIIKLKRVLE